MASKALNDDEVITEMNKMVAFIKQEAQEKAREIKVKADEEFAIEKAKIFRDESQAIDNNFEKKRKAAETALKITQSTQTNKSRLRLLQSREQHLQDLFSTTRAEISKLSEDEGKYVQLLQSSILQGLLAILEPEVRVLARKKDQAIAQQAADGASKAYKELSGRDVQVSVDATLSDDGAGGVKLISSNTRITVDNTLDDRLKLLEHRMLPEIRTELFGVNDNRKFYT